MGTNIMNKNNRTKVKVSFQQKLILVMFGIILTGILLETGLRLGGFILSSLQERRNRISIAKKGSYRIMCLGESTTAFGEKDSYPSQLEEILSRRNNKIKFSIINKGIPGSDTTFILAQLEDNLNKYNPDMVIAMMGINEGLTEYMPDDDKTAPSKASIFLNHFKVYKLARFICLCITAKMKETKSNLLKKDSLSPVHLQYYYGQDENAGFLKKATQGVIEQSSADDSEYVKLGWAYNGEGNFIQAEEVFKKALELSPRNEGAYIGLGHTYVELGDFLKMEESFKKAIELNPRNDNTYVILGHMVYCSLGKISEAEELFKKAIEINPKNEDAYFELGCFYKQEGNPVQAEKMFQKIIKINPFNDRAYGALEVICREKGEERFAEEYHRKIAKLRQEYYNTATRDNYLKLKKILDRKGIQLVCVQYPMRSIEPLKKIFADQEGVMFVDNEKTFKKALKRGSYKEYFSDMFGGDFGHCTPRGNRLLAESIANAILK